MWGIFSLSFALFGTPQSTDPARADGLPLRLELGSDRVVAPAAQEGDSIYPWSLEGRVEVSQDQEKFLDSTNNLGLTRQELEHDLHQTATHDSAMLRLAYTIALGLPTQLKIYAAGGVERIGAHLRAGVENEAFGTPAGSTETDFDFGLAPVWDVGAEFRLGLGDGPFDLAASVGYRGAGDSEEDAATREEYHYQRLQAGLYAGWSISPTVRPYLGAHYSYYRARFRIIDETTGADVEFRLGYKIPIDAVVGVSLESSRLIGTVEVDFVGKLAILASAGFRF